MLDLVMEKHSILNVAEEEIPPVTINDDESENDTPDCRVASFTWNIFDRINIHKFSMLCNSKYVDARNLVRNLHSSTF